MALKHVILTALYQEPATGYDIVKYFDDVVGFFWSASHQQVYRDLAQLTEDGLVRFTVVSQEHRPDKKVYELTDAGREALRTWVEKPLKPRPVKDELLVKLFAGELVGPSALKKLLRDERTRRRQKLEVYYAIEEEHFSAQALEGMSAGERLAYMTLRRGILGEENWFTWAAEVEEVLQDME